jgi:hypothetical protein
MSGTDLRDPTAANGLIAYWISALMVFTVAIIVLIYAFRKQTTPAWKILS